jgi:AraC-like DNA-binding protein
VDAPPADFRALCYSTGEAPPRDRLDVWRHLLSRKLVRAKVDPFSPAPFLAHVEMRVLPEARVGMGTVDASIMRRERDDIANDNDDFLITVNLDGTFVATQRHGEHALGAGDAVLINCAEQGTYIRPSRGGLLCVRVPRAALVGSVSNLDDAMSRVIRRDVGALRLLTTYGRYLCDVHTPLDSAELRRAVTEHLVDLAALAIGATRDAAAMARGRGARVARLRAIQEDVIDHLGRSDLSVAAVAARHHITPRQVQRLFESEGITFSDYLLEQRLNRALDILRDERLVRATINSVAYQCGFGEISYFNRTFRRRFGATPTEIRERSLSEAGRKG